jgi:hypothetical protein
VPHGQGQNRGRILSGWRKKHELLLAKAPVLVDEKPSAIPDRKINCRRYEKCLDYAIAQDWYGFHCDACPVDDEFTQDELLAKSYGVFSGVLEYLDTNDEQPMEVEPVENDYLTVDEAVELLGTSKVWCMRLANRGDIETRKDGDTLLFNRASVLKRKAPTKEPVRAKPKTDTKPVSEPSDLKKVKLLVDCVEQEIMDASEAFGKIRKIVAG